MGANKFATLQEVLLWSKGIVRPPGLLTQHPEGGETTQEVFEASHLCHHPRCMIADHICLEHRDDNQQRKGCVPWVECSDSCRSCGGKKVIMLCPHSPRCIKWIATYPSQEALEANGICRDDGEAIRNKRWYDRVQHEELRTPKTAWPEAAPDDSS